MKQFLAPMTEMYADFRNIDDWEPIEVDEHDPMSSMGYAPVSIDPGLGKLTNFILDSGFYDFRNAKLFILNAKTQEQMILNHAITSLERSDCIPHFVEMASKITCDPPTARWILEYRSIIHFEWTPMDTVTIGPDLWFQMEIQKARQKGLIFSVNGLTLPIGLMNSMGSKLVDYADRHNLI